MSEKHIGKVIQVIGPVLDIQFKDGELPELLNAIEIDNHGQKLVVEVAQLTGDNVARCIAMSSTDGLVRGTDAVDTGVDLKAITVNAVPAETAEGLTREIVFDDVDHDDNSTARGVFDQIKFEK